MPKVSEDAKTGLIAGVFDLMHAGHVIALKDARKQCDHLIVALHAAPTDPSKNQPIMSVSERELLLRSCRWVDEVICYSTEHQLIGMLAKQKISIRFLGEEYRTRPITGSDLPIEIRFLSRDHGLSTSEMRSRIHAAEAVRLAVRKLARRSEREPEHAVR